MSSNPIARYLTFPAKGLLAFLLASLIFVPRIVDLAAFINTDACYGWIGRSLRFYANLAAFNPAGTLQAGHPGVLVMLLSGAFMLLGSLIKYGSWSPWDHVKELLFYAKLPLALLTGFSIILTCWLIKRYNTRSFFPYVLLFFLAIDPLFLTYSRYLHLDATNAALMLLCLVTLAIYLREQDTQLLWLSAIFAGLALLTRSTSLALVPYVFAALVVDYSLNNKGRLSSLFRRLVAWAGIAIVVFVFLWPAMWVSPFRTLTSLAGGVTSALETPHEITGSANRTANMDSNLQRGNRNSAPGRHVTSFNSRLFLDLVTYRSMVILFLAAVGLITLAYRLSKERVGNTETILLHLTIFSLYFLVGMSFFRKATTIDFGFRYILFCFITIQILAAYGAHAAVVAALRQTKTRKVLAYSSLCALVTLLATEMYRVFSLHPYYQTYHNEYVTPSFYGWGEGLELVAGHLNSRDNARELTVASYFPCVLGFRFKGKTVHLEDFGDGSGIDYLVLYNSQVSRGLFPTLTTAYQIKHQGALEFVAMINGIEYAWLYRVR
jgi:hypothetical protein